MRRVLGQQIKARDEQEPAQDDALARAPKGNVLLMVARVMLTHGHRSYPSPRAAQEIVGPLLLLRRESGVERTCRSLDCLHRVQAG
jgi:hypothetical protein